MLVLYVREVGKPRVTLVPYLEGWSYDFTARALLRHLAHRFELRLGYKRDISTLMRARPDLIVDFWWKGSIATQNDVPVVKQVSSHRWSSKRYRTLTPHRMVKRYLRPCAGVVVPSVRLRETLNDAAGLTALPISICPKGFNPESMFDYAARRGPITFAWAGCAAAADKCVDLLLEACPELRIADMCLVQSEMCDFYNGADVITCASIAEGDPRPIIEGMACGCFPITTDVGIVPELVRHGENGLIVPRTREAFEKAFAWCRANPERVRAAGHANAREMLTKRTWAHVAPAWGEAFDAALARGSAATAA